MAGDQGMIIAKRSVSLTKSYPIIGVVLSLVGLGLSGLSGALRSIPTTGPAGAAQGGDIAAAVPYLAVPLQALAALLFATPVLLLFVYDKNNGVLEYLLSLGMTQRDIYRQYLKAALILAAVIVAFGAVVDLVSGAVLGDLALTAGIAVLVVAMGVSAVSFGTILMMSFSSLQKQRVGSNQPLGMTIGVFLVLPTYILPFVAPEYAFPVDLVLAGIIVTLSLATYFVAGRLISREKLLP